MTGPTLLGVDWGSSRLRGYAVAATGGVLQSVQSDAGVLMADQSDMAGALVGVLAEWTARWPNASVIASGMVGSRTGLKELPYVRTPATVSEVHAGMEIVEVGSLSVAIVPGLVHRGKFGVDVMRGEETILLGSATEGVNGIVVLPGTHSKWARVDDGQIAEFCTFATGELFNSLLHSGSLRDLLPVRVTHDAEAFREGVILGLESVGILRDYFSVRSEVVTGGASADGISSRLSGLLIGYELAEARNRAIATPGEPVTIVGDGVLIDRYEQAMKIAGMTATVLSAIPFLARGWLLLSDRVVS